MIECLCVQVKCYGTIVLVLGLGANMLNMFDMWNSVSTKLEQTNIQQSQQPHTSGGSIKGNFHLIKRGRLFGANFGPKVSQLLLEIVGVVRNYSVEFQGSTV